MKEGDDSLFLVLIVEGIIQSFVKNLLRALESSRWKRGKIYVFTLRRKKEMENIQFDRNELTDLKFYPI